MPGLEDLLTGQTLVKRYRISEVIGRGGFAVVYRAEDERLGRPVAVKVITIAEQDPAAVALHRDRFEQEARAAASLPQHPNVVTVHDFGIDPVLGIDFLVMEFLHGEDLATRLRREGPPQTGEAVRILRDAAAGIAVGHRAGIVHRDVKPGNIFLADAQPGEPGRVCILDFGIARALGEDQTLGLEAAEGTALSPAYASPEQTRGAAEITSASDVFSLGVVGYQLLTGEKPFAPQRGMDPAEGVPPRTIRQVNPGVSAEVEGVVLRAMAFDPRDRFSSADDLCAALAAGGQAEQTIVMPPAGSAASAGAGAAPAEPEADRTLYQPPAALPPRQRIAYAEPHRAERKRGRGGVLLLLLLLLAAGGAAGWWFLTREPAVAGGVTDPSADADIEVISEGLEATDPPADDAGEAIGGDAPPLPVAAPEPAPADTAGAVVDTVPAPQRDTVPAQPVAAPEPADTVPAPPPPLLGVPVDSVAAASPAAGEASPATARSMP